MKIELLNNFPAELRPFEEKDADALFDLVERNRAYLKQWLPWLDANTTLNDTLAFIRHSMEHYRLDRSIQAGIWYQNELAGAIGHHPIDWPNKVVMVGYWLGEGYQGKGIMTEACRAFVNFSLSEYKLNRVEIRCATGNVKSCAIPSRLGFTVEGTIRSGEWLYDHFVDLIIYGMLSRDWPSLS